MNEGKIFFLASVVILAAAFLLRIARLWRALALLRRQAGDDPESQTAPAPSASPDLAVPVVSPPPADPVAPPHPQKGKDALLLEGVAAVFLLTAAVVSAFD